MSVYVPTQEEYRVIRSMYDPSNKLNDEQIKLFLHVAKERNLDPKLKQICLIPHYNKNTGRTEGTHVTQIDGLRLIAERTKRYSPGKETEFLYDEKGHLVGAKAFVKKLTPDGTWHNVSAVALMKEYSTGKSLWVKMPHVMIEKCAESRALRRAFPDALSGLYEEGEMEQALEGAELLSEPLIDDETWEALDNYLNGHDELRNKLKELCKVDDLRKIKMSQLDACREFAKKYKDRLKAEAPPKEEVVEVPVEEVRVEAAPEDVEQFDLF